VKLEAAGATHSHTTTMAATPSMKGADIPRISKVIPTVSRESSAAKPLEEPVEVFSYRVFGVFMVAQVKPH